MMDIHLSPYPNLTPLAFDEQLSKTFFKIPKYIIMGLAFVCPCIYLLTSQ